MKQTPTYQPEYFFLSTLFIASVALFIAAYASYHESYHYLLFPLILGSMASPSIVAFFMFTKARNKILWHDFFQRMRINKINVRFIPLVLFLMPCIVLLAITVSLLFGFSADQFSLAQIADKALEGKNFLALIAIVLISCSLEEIGWRGYGIDSLTSRYNLWRTSLIFAALWSLWHVPSFFIKNGYFQQEVWNLGMVYTVTYFISLFPITVLINWLYVKNNRSILIAILFHAIMNLSYGLLLLQPFTKIIIMLLLLITAAIIVIKDKEIFFKKSAIA
ncbi:type II CAAX endopeptidase family protein [soil metagenome]